MPVTGPVVLILFSLKGWRLIMENLKLSDVNYLPSIVVPSIFPSDPDPQTRKSEIRIWNPVLHQHFAALGFF
jgi:hypothetical protein